MVPHQVWDWTAPREPVRVFSACGGDPCLVYHACLWGRTLGDLRVACGTAFSKVIRSPDVCLAATAASTLLLLYATPYSSRLNPYFYFFLPSPPIYNASYRFSCGPLDEDLDNHECHQSLACFDSRAMKGLFSGIPPSPMSSSIVSFSSLV